MKRIIVSFLILITCNANADTITGVCSSSPYGWSYTYDIGYYNDAINVEMNLMAVGYDDYDLLGRFESGIEDRWTTYRFDVPIIFDVEWVDISWHKRINIHEGYGRSTVHNWYSDGYWSREYVAAHEFGHLIGLYDEYQSGAIDPETGYVNTGGLMHTNGYTLDYYYDDIMEWYVAMNDTTSQTPEPATMLLLGSGLLIVSHRIRRMKL